MTDAVNVNGTVEVAPAELERARDEWFDEQDALAAETDIRGLR